MWAICGTLMSSISSQCTNVLKKYEGSNSKSEGRAYVEITDNILNVFSQFLFIINSIIERTVRGNSISILFSISIRGLEEIEQSTENKKNRVSFPEKMNNKLVFDSLDVVGLRIKNFGKEILLANRLIFNFKKSVIFSEYML